MQRWTYGYAVYDGAKVSDIRLGEIGSPGDVGFEGLLDCAGFYGWEFCGSLPEPDIGAAIADHSPTAGPRCHVLIFKRPRS
jgi:hypothetical protein